MEALDRTAEILRIPDEDQTSQQDGIIFNGPDHYYKRGFDYFADICLQDSNDCKEKQTGNTLGLLTSAVRDLRPVRQDYIFRPMHASNDVYMKPGLEEQWQRLAHKCHPYPTGDDIEDAYWRTLIGNRRSGIVSGVHKPPETWREAYAIEGRDLSMGGTFAEPKKEFRPLSKELHTYLRNSTIEQQQNTLDKQLKASGMRAIISTAISVSIAPEGDVDDLKDFRPPLGQDASAEVTLNFQANKLVQNNCGIIQKQPELVITQRKKPAESQILPKETIEQVADWVQRYPHIQSNEKEQLMEILFPLAVANVEKEEPIETQRAKIDQAFRCDFLRMARNRKFCITKKRYMGWCPSNTKAGDRICILFGGQTPYVVRKEKQGYRLLGEAYIHGVMDGEVLSMPWC
ncbi:MAG: hypothetical protein Q9209_007112 [Squamulea sp. 1 TL-2023]